MVVSDFIRAPTTATPRRAAVITLGCKVNTFESAVMAQRLAEDRWTVVDPRDAADLYVINSCTVTAEADRQTRQATRRVLRQNPSAQVIVTGCYAQNEPAGCATIPGVSLVLGNDHKLAVAQAARELPRGSRPDQVPMWVDRLSSLPATLLNGYESRTRAFVQIQQGCDQSCTFCVIHRARGQSRSFDRQSVLRQIHTFVDQGYREIVLCGVDLGSYSDLSDDKRPEITSLTRLVQEIATLPGDFRVRLSSIDPAHIDDLLLSALAQSNRFCPYLHVSLQSGSTLILKRMKRRYDAVFLMERLEAARERIGSLVLGADVMAGFPTETESDFDCTLEILKKANIVYPHVFAYSARPRTPAARIPRQVPRDERRRRAAELRQVGQHLRAEALAGMNLNKGHLLVERASEPSGPTTYHGRLENYMPVRLKGPIPPVGTLVEVVVTGVDGDVLIAEALSAD